MASFTEFSPLTSNEPVKTYSLFTGFALCINMIIGTGVFNLPYAIYNAGFLLSIIILIICGFFSWICLVWTLEVCARAEGISSVNSTSINTPSGSVDSSSGLQGNDFSKGSITPYHQITMRKFDMNQLCELFYGRRGMFGCQLLLSLYCYGLLWAYSAVFSTSVNDLFWQFTRGDTCSPTRTSFECTIGYYVCLLIYASIVVPVSLLNVTEQAVIQVMLTCYRFTAFGVMCVTIIYGLSHEVNPFLSNATNTNVYVKWSGFADIFTTAAVALNFHFAVPDLVKPVEKKTHLVGMTSAALLVASSFYLIVGILCSVYFGDNVSQLVTLNWQNYTGAEGGWGPVDKRPWWAIMIQLIVMLFPILDMLSVFPLIGVTLGDNLSKLFPDHSLFQVCSPDKICCGSHKRDTKLTRIICRLLSTVPPILLAAAAGSLDEIFKFTGLFAFFLQLIIPCFLQLRSRAVCNQWGEHCWKTMYSMCISEKVWVYGALLFGCGALLFALLDFILGVANIHLWR